MEFIVLNICLLIQFYSMFNCNQFNQPSFIIFCLLIMAPLARDVCDYVCKNIYTCFSYTVKHGSEYTQAGKVIKIISTGKLT